jgi:hypothetical protein
MLIGKSRSGLVFKRQQLLDAWHQQCDDAPLNSLRLRKLGAQLFHLLRQRKQEKTKRATRQNGLSAA